MASALSTSTAEHGAEGTLLLFFSDTLIVTCAVPRRSEREETGKHPRCSGATVMPEISSLFSNENGAKKYIPTKMLLPKAVPLDVQVVGNDALA